MIHALAQAGHNVLPVGTANDPKAPAMAFTGRRLDPRQTIAVCHRNGSGAYGVRCDNLVVIDFDDYRPDQQDFARQRFGAPSVEVGTARGVHWYYRRSPKFDPRSARVVLSDAGIQADVKSGQSEFVIGPQSQRADGVNYHPISGDLAHDDLALIEPLADIKPDKLRLVQKGFRHKELRQLAVVQVPFCDSPDELVENLRLHADLNFDDPSSVSMKEIRGIVRWTWEKHVAGTLVCRDGRGFFTPSSAMQQIGGNPDALALFFVLMNAHADLDRVFVLRHEAMREKGLIDLSRRRFRAARDHLISVGVLCRVEPAVPRVSAATYSLNPKGEGLICISGPELVQGGYQPHD
ncbi:MAG: bifunctional DNA primase/polymerase [Pseudomonadota bacterium]